MGMRNWRQNLRSDERLRPVPKLHLEGTRLAPVTPMNLSDVLSKLPVIEILDAVCQLTIPTPFRRKKEVLTKFILGNLTPEVEKNLRDKLVVQAAKPGTSRGKRKRDEPQPTPTRKSPRVDSDEPRDDGEFLELPPDAILKSCYHQFYEATSNVALTGGKGSLTQWVHCEFVVSFEAIRPVITQRVCGEFF